MYLMMKMKFEQEQNHVSIMSPKRIRKELRKGLIEGIRSEQNLQTKVETLVSFTIRLAMGERGKDIPRRGDIIREIKQMLALHNLKDIKVINPLINLFPIKPSHGVGDPLAVSLFTDAKDALHSCEIFIENQIRREKETREPSHQKKLKVLFLPSRKRRLHSSNCNCFSCSY